LVQARLILVGIVVLWWIRGALCKQRLFCYVSVSDSVINVDRCLSQVGGIVGFGGSRIANSRVSNVELRGNGDMGGVAGRVDSLHGNSGIVDNVVTNVII